MNNNKCTLCFSELTPERIEALIFLGTSPSEYKCLECSSLTTRKIKGQFMGASGVSPLMLCDDIKNDKPIWDEVPSYSSNTSEYDTTTEEI